MILDSAVDRYRINIVYKIHKQMHLADHLPMVEHATTCLAHRISRLAVLRIVAICRAITPHRALPDTKYDVLNMSFNHGF